MKKKKKQQQRIQRCQYLPIFSKHYFAWIKHFLLLLFLRLRLLWWKTEKKSYRVVGNLPFRTTIITHNRIEGMSARVILVAIQNNETEKKQLFHSNHTINLNNGANFVTPTKHKNPSVDPTTRWAVIAKLKYSNNLSEWNEREKKTATKTKTKTMAISIIYQNKLTWLFFRLNEESFEINLISLFPSVSLSFSLALQNQQFFPLQVALFFSSLFFSLRSLSVCVLGVLKCFFFFLS